MNNLEFNKINKENNKYLYVSVAKYCFQYLKSIINNWLNNNFVQILWKEI